MLELPDMQNETPTQAEKKKIVILGTGFGGIYTFLHLKKHLCDINAEITLVGKTNYFLFTPMLHEVATGGLNQEHIVESVRSIIKGSNAKFIQTSINSIDLTNKVVDTECCPLPYDYLVIATGADTNTFGIQGVTEWCLDLKDLSDASKLRNLFIETFETASKEPQIEEQKKLLSFAIVGGGATGVELAAEVSELFFETMDKYYPQINNGTASVKLLSATSELLLQFDPELRKRALDSLQKKNVEVLLNSQVTKVEEDGFILSNGDRIPATHKIWVAGVKPNTPKFDVEVELDKAKRLVTNGDLRVKGRNEVFAIGDVASVQDKDGKALPMLAQVAVKQAKTVAENIAILCKGGSDPLSNFEYESSGSLVSLGQKDALGDLWGLKLHGPHIWWLWRTVYLMKMTSFKKMFKVAVDWTVNLFYPRDITKS